MVEIPTYHRRLSIPSSSGMAPLDASAFSGLSGSARRFAAAAEGLVDELGRREKKQQEVDAVAWVSQRTAEGRRYWVEQFTEASKGAGEGAPEFTPKLMSSFDDWRTDQLEAAPNDLAREIAGERFEGLKTSLYADALKFETVARGAQRTAGYAASVADLSAAVRAKPGDWRQILQQASGDLDAAEATFMMPEQVTKWRTNIPGAIAAGAMRGRIDRDPASALTVLSGEGDDLAQALSDADRKTLSAEARAELARRAAKMRAQEQALSKELSAARGVIDAGYDPGDDVLADLRRRAAGTSLAPEAQALRQTKEFTTEIRTWTPKSLQQWVNDENARLQEKGKVTEAEAARVTTATRILDTMSTELARDPLSWAVRVGMADVGAIAFSGDDALPTMKARRGVAAEVAATYGTPLRLLTDEEETELKDLVATGSADQQLAVVTQLNLGLGADAPAVLARVAKDQPVFAHAGGLATMGRVQATSARDALVGVEAIRNGNKVQPPATDRNEWIDDELGASLGRLPMTRANLIKTAEAIYTARALRAGVTADDGDAEDLFKQALADAAGAAGDTGGFGEFNDYRVLVPVGMNADDFEDMLDDFTDDDLLRGSLGGGEPMHTGGKPFTAEDFDDARLVDYGPGLYLVETDFGFVAGSGPNGFYVLNMNEILRPYEGRHR